MKFSYWSAFISVFFFSCYAQGNDEFLEKFDNFKNRVEQQCLVKLSADSDLSMEDVMNIVSQGAFVADLTTESKPALIELAKKLKNENQILPLILLSAMSMGVTSQTNIYIYTGLFARSIIHAWNNLQQEGGGEEEEEEEEEENSLMQRASLLLEKQFTGDEKEKLIHKLVTSISAKNDLPNPGIIPVIGRLGIMIPATYTLSLQAATNSL